MTVRLPAPQRRRQLLDVSREVFADRGFHSTSMDDVAQAAGVTKPVLYQHFGSKRRLYLELLDDLGRQILDAVTKATAEAQGPRRQVEAGFAAYLRFVGSNESAFRLLFGSGTRRDEEFADTVAGVEEAIAEAVAALIEADLEPEHRELLAMGILGLAEGVGRHWLRRQRHIDADVVARQVSELAWAGLRGVRPV